MYNRTILIIFTCLIIPSISHAQDTATADTLYGWKHSLVSGLTLTQVALKDWEQGGENAFAYTGSIKGASVDEEVSLIWNNNYELAFGQAQLGDKGIRKTDDRINFESVFTYKLFEDSKLNPFAAASFKSQFAKGFEYDSIGQATVVSAFLDPAYITQSIGASYRPVPEFTTRLGAALREIITSKFTKYADDSDTPEIETTAVEGGLESVSNLRWEFAENMLLTSELGLFAPVETLDRISVRGASAVAAKVNSFITVLVGLEVINEPRVSTRTQLRESLAIGFSYALL